MKILNNVDTYKVIGIDIEAVRLYENLEDAPEQLQQAWAYDHKWKDTAKLAQNTEEDLVRLWVEEAAFKPEFSKVCAVSLVFVANGQLRCKEFASYDEALILEALAETLNKFPKEYTLTGHASFFYDFPFLALRYLYNRMPVPDMLDESGASPWLKKLMDTNYVRKSFGSTTGGSLLSLCTAFGIPFSKDAISGADVGTYYFQGRLKEISAYCSLDTVACYNLLRAFKNEPIFNPDEVIYVNQGEILCREGVLTELLKEGKFTPAIKKKVIETYATLGDNEREHFKLLLRSITVKTPSEKESEKIISSL